MDQPLRQDNGALLPPGYTLAPLGTQHLTALVLLDQRCYGGHWGAQGYLDELERTHSVVLGCFQDGSLVGFGILWRVLSEAHIISLAVDPDHRRQGIARALLHSLLNHAVATDCEWATLEVREHNSAAIQLYEQQGFQLLGRRKHYYADTHEDALVYWKQFK